MAEEIWRVCSFTGHRSIEPRHLRRLPDMINRALGYVYDRGCREFCIGGAVGFDTVAAQQILLFRMTHRDVILTLLLPCLDQTERWSERQKEMYEHLLGSADNVRYVSETYTSTCMKRRNRLLVDSCDVLVAYVGRSYSGAAQTVRMAEQSGRQIFNLYPQLDREG